MKSTEHINMDGLEVNREILKALRNFKQGSILESNYLQMQHVISNDVLSAHHSFNVKEYTKNEMMQRLSRELIEKYKDSFEETETPYGVQLSLSMLTMSTSELKHVVEYCIRTMPQTAIEEIRK